MKDESWTRPSESFHGHLDSSVAALLALGMHNKRGPMATALGSNQGSRERIHRAEFNIHFSSFIVHLGISINLMRPKQIWKQPFWKKGYSVLWSALLTCREAAVYYGCDSRSTIYIHTRILEVARNSDIQLNPKKKLVSFVEKQLKKKTRNELTKSGFFKRKRLFFFIYISGSLHPRKRSFKSFFSFFNLVRFIPRKK